MKRCAYTKVNKAKPGSLSAPGLFALQVVHILQPSGGSAVVQHLRLHGE